MILTDTHTHLYLNAFDDDRTQVVERAMAQDVGYMFLPNIDSDSVDPMLELCDQFPGHCFPMLGLHPTSVKEDADRALDRVLSRYEDNRFIAIGEIGIDLYWDKTYFEQQQKVFRRQIEFAAEKELPIVIHCRDSFNEIMDILTDYRDSGIKGVFHCFTGTMEEAGRVLDLGFLLGIGGVLTFKNSGLDRVVRQIELRHILLETDSPFLAPVPFRGKRNESTYTNIIATRLSELKQISREEIARVTTQNAIELFKIRTHE